MWWVDSVVGWLRPAPTQLLTHFPTPSKLGAENKKKKSKKTHRSISGYFNRWRKREENQIKQRKLLTTSHRQTDAQASLQTTATLEAKSPFSLYSSFYHSAWCYMIWNSPLASSSWLSWPCPIPISCLSTAYLLWEQSRKKRKPWPCARSVQQQPKHWCVINTVLATNLKHSSLWNAIKKVKSSSVGLSTKENCPKKLGIGNLGV